MKLFSVYDKQVSAFGPLFPARAVGEALRTIMDAMVDQSSHLGKHPADFSLFEIGEWDDQVGHLKQESDHPRWVAELMDLGK